MNNNITRELSELTLRVMNPGQLPPDVGRVEFMVDRHLAGKLQDMRGPALMAMIRHSVKEQVEKAIADTKKAVTQAAKAAQDKIEGQALEIQRLQSELRSAINGTGLYENKTLTEAQGKVAAAERKVQALTDAAKAQAQELASLKAELAGKDAAIMGYARDIQQLMTATVHLNEDHDSQIKNARTFLTAARDNLDDRYGQKLPPFLKVVRDDLVRGLNCLAPKQ